MNKHNQTDIDKTRLKLQYYKNCSLGYITSKEEFNEINTEIDELLGLLKKLEALRASN